MRHRDCFSYRGATPIANPAQTCGLTLASRDFSGHQRKERARAIADAETLAARLIQNSYGSWIAEVKRKTSFAGIVILQDVPFDAHFTPSLEVGWHLAAEHWGNGYATEGARGALAFAFNEFGRTEVVAIAATINLPSQRVMQRLGLTQRVLLQAARLGRRSTLPS